MDPRMLDTVWMAYRQVGAREPINVVCGYRAPATNAMLRRRSRGVAKFSQHTLGKAMDFYIPGVNLASLRAAGLRLQRGGVGFYPTSGSPFVHMDAGSVRMWPRMTRDQLAAVFPDGKTVHVPADGRPMPGYQAALAELRRGGGSVGGFAGGGEDDAGGSASGSGFGLASLFGGTSSPPSSSGRKDSPHAVLMADAQRRANGSTPAATAEPSAPVVAEAAPPAPVAKTVLAMAAIPLPEPRPRDTQPAMAWQTGPGPAVETASVPLPPLRPGEEAPAAAAPQMQLAALDAPSTAGAAVKPRVLEPSAPVMSDVSRTPGALFSREASPAARALGYASAEVAGDLDAPLVRRGPGLVATRFEDLDFGDVTTPVASARDTTQAALTRPDLDTVATLIPAPSRVVVIRFGVAAYQDLRSGRFTGSAIRPLKTASVASPSDIVGSIASAN